VFVTGGEETGPAFDYLWKLEEEEEEEEEEEGWGLRVLTSLLCHAHFHSTIITTATTATTKVRGMTNDKTVIMHDYHVLA